ncbi:MAG TPA: adenosylcobinamide-GDP ribazoletransferase [Mycobacteriales bacterium]|nr:adenosylcobinamide-GDP ribazoletransferase [Mycobacteriales bacterium]
MASPLDGVRLSLTLFTVAPVRGPHEITRSAARTALLLSPLVGAGLGALCGFAAYGLRHASGSPLLGAAVAVALMGLLTRGLHIDGLADTTDGLATHKPAQDALAIMRKGDVGPLGAAAVAAVLVVDVAALASCRSAVVPLAIAAAAGRLAVVRAAQPSIPVAEGSSMGRTFGGTVPFVAMVVTTVATIGGALGLGVAAYPGRRGRIVAAVAVGAAIVIGDLARRRAVRRLGGVNGDVWGAIIELATAAALVTLACAR